MNFIVELRKMFDAGMYDLVREDHGEAVRLKISRGQPFSSAYREAKDLAALLDCELRIDGEAVLFSSENELREKFRNPENPKKEKRDE